MKFTYSLQLTVRKEDSEIIVLDTISSENFLQLMARFLIVVVNAAERVQEEVDRYRVGPDDDIPF